MISNITRKTYKAILLFFAVTVLALLCAYNASSTAYLINWEHTVYIDDSVKKQVFLIILSIAMLLKFKESKLYGKLAQEIQNDAFFTRIRFVLLATIFIGCIVWIFCTQFVPGVDEYSVQSIVMQAVNGDFSEFQSMRYMDQYPNQWGIFVISYL